MRKIGVQRNLSAQQLAVKKNRQLFYGIPFIVVSDHQPLQNLGSLATKVNRVQRWFDFLSAYNYKLVYRPGRLNGNADLMSRLPLPATAEDTSANLRLSDPSDVDVYFVGASGVQPRLGRRRDISLGGLGCRTEGRDISLGGLECRTKGKGISLGWAGVSNAGETHQLRWAGVSNRRFF